MRVYALIVGHLLLVTPAAIASDCDFFIQFDRAKIEACFKELKSELDNTKLELQTLRLENSGLEGNLCLLATEAKRKNPELELAHVIDTSCANLRARAAARSRAKNPKPTKPIQ